MVASHPLAQRRPGLGLAEEGDAALDLQRAVTIARDLGSVAFAAFGVVDRAFPDVACIDEAR